MKRNGLGFVYNPGTKWLKIKHKHKNDHRTGLLMDKAGQNETSGMTPTTDQFKSYGQSSNLIS